MSVKIPSLCFFLFWALQLCEGQNILALRHVEELAIKNTQQAIEHTKSKEKATNEESVSAAYEIAALSKKRHTGNKAFKQSISAVYHLSKTLSAKQKPLHQTNEQIEELKSRLKKERAAIKHSEAAAAAATLVSKGSGSKGDQAVILSLSEQVERIRNQIKGQPQSLKNTDPYMKQAHILEAKIQKLERNIHTLRNMQELQRSQHVAEAKRQVEHQEATINAEQRAADHDTERLNVLQRNKIADEQVVSPLQAQVHVLQSDLKTQEQVLSSFTQQITKLGNAILGFDKIKVAEERELKQERKSLSRHKIQEMQAEQQEEITK
jgi:hypothetical protein